MSSAPLAHPKASPLSPGLRIQKRPLIHPPVPTPKAASEPKIIYISTRTPFISAVKRAQTLLGTQEVTMKASGKAINMALQIGLYFQETERESVVVRTGSVDAVDDIVAMGEEADVMVVEQEGVEEGVRKGKRRGEEYAGDVEMGASMRVRKISTVEIVIGSARR